MTKLFQYSYLTLALSSVFSVAYATENNSLDQIDIYETITSQSQLYSPNISYVGTKVATPLVRTPMGITVVTEKQIQDRNAQDIAQSLDYTSGLLSAYRGKNSMLEIMVRGIGNKSDGGGVPTYLNGIAYQGSYEMDPFFLESINVIKGPASVLYGQANPGGVVDIVSKKPTKKDRTLLQAKVGTDDYYQLGLDMDRKINDQLSLRVVGNLKRLDWKERFTRQQGGTIAPSLTWSPSQQTDWTISLFYQKNPKMGQRNFLMKEGTIESVNGSKLPYDFFVGDPNYHKLALEQYHLGSQFSHRFNENITFRQNLRYTKSDNDHRELLGWSYKGDTTYGRVARAFRDVYHEFGVDNQLETKFTTGSLNHTLLSGVEYKQFRYDSVGYHGQAPSIDWTNPVYGVTINPPDLLTSSVKVIKQTGIYLQDQISVGNVDFLLGGRYDVAHNRYDERYSMHGSPSEHKQRDYKFTWRTGAIYNFANGIAPYISYSTSFQPEIGVDSQNNVLKPTTAKQYEIGLKYQPNEHILFTTALYRILQHNLVTTDPNTREKTQTGETRTNGVEVALSADLTENISVIGSYAYTKRKVTQDKDPSNVGKKPWGVPYHQGSLWAKYAWHNGVLDGLDIGAGVRYMGTTQDRTNTIRVPHYTLYDMSVGYDLAKLSSSLKGATVQVNLNNLTNKKYVASCASGDTCFYGTERTVVATFNYQW